MLYGAPFHVIQQRRARRVDSARRASAGTAGSRGSSSSCGSPQTQQGSGSAAGAATGGGRRSQLRGTPPQRAPSRRPSRPIKHVGEEVPFNESACDIAS